MTMRFYLDNLGRVSGPGRTPHQMPRVMHVQLDNARRRPRSCSYGAKRNPTKRPAPKNGERLGWKPFSKKKKYIYIYMYKYIQDIWFILGWKQSSEIQNPLEMRSGFVTSFPHVKTNFHHHHDHHHLPINQMLPKSLPQFQPKMLHG